MSELNETPPSQRRAGVALDTWAVLLALVLVGLVRLGWLPKIGW